MKVCDAAFGKLMGGVALTTVATLAVPLYSRMGIHTGKKRTEVLRRPILVGLSRKSFLKLIGGSESLALTHELALVWAAARGAAIWRVHDVPAALRAARVVGALGRGAETA